MFAVSLKTIATTIATVKHSSTPVVFATLALTNDHLLRRLRDGLDFPNRDAPQFVRVATGPKIDTAGANLRRDISLSTIFSRMRSRLLVSNDGRRGSDGQPLKIVERV